MHSRRYDPRCWALLLSLLVSTGLVSEAAPAPAQGGACPAGHLYLTLDTGTMAAANHIAEMMRVEHIRATFFLANEPTFRGDDALDDHWAGYWRDRVAEGHVFGSHTWSHASVRMDLPGGRVRATLPDGKAVVFDRDGYCQELGKVDARFAEMTGQHLAPLWRAPGGHTTAQTLAWAASCGFPKHVGWPDTGFLGDELPSEKYSNQFLLDRALHHVRDGDILMMHLGIHSRKDPFAAVFRPLIAGLKARGFCFDTLKP